MGQFGYPVRYGQEAAGGVKPDLHEPRDNLDALGLELRFQAFDRDFCRGRVLVADPARCPLGV